MLLIDSTKYISWMRAGRNPINVLAAHLRARELVSCGIVRIEVLRGMVKPRARDEISRLFEIIPEIPIDPKAVSNAADTAWQLDREGKVIPVTDLIIAACAMRAGATIVTEDPHFSDIPNLTCLTTLHGK